MFWKFCDFIDLDPDPNWSNFVDPYPHQWKIVWVLKLLDHIKGEVSLYRDLSDETTVNLNNLVATVGMKPCSVY